MALVRTGTMLNAARALAEFTRVGQNVVMHWGRVLARGAFRIALAKSLEEQDGQLPGSEREDTAVVPESAKRFGISATEHANAPTGFTCDLEIDGRSANVPDDVRATMESIIQDFDGVPSDYLVAAGPGLYKSPRTGKRQGPAIGLEWHLS